MKNISIGFKIVKLNYKNSPLRGQSRRCNIKEIDVMMNCMELLKVSDNWRAIINQTLLGVSVVIELDS